MRTSTSCLASPWPQPNGTEPVARSPRTAPRAIVGHGVSSIAVVISIDAGTTCVGAFAVDDHGTPCGLRSREIGQHVPRPGWVEHDTTEIWSTTQAVLRDLLNDLDGASVAAIGIANQRETIVAWSRTTGRPLAPAIVCQDRRTSARCDELGANRDAVFDELDSWLLWNLTGGTAARGAVPATDASNASRTMLFEIRAGECEHELCERFGVAPDRLPRARRPAGRAAGPGMSRAGNGEEHVRHRLVRAVQRGRSLPRRGRRIAHHRRVPDREHAHMRTRARSS